MNRLASAISVFVLLALTIQILGAWSLNAKLNNGQTRMDKRRYKRQMSQPGFRSLLPFQTTPSCGYFSPQTCPAYNNFVRGGYALGQTIRYVSQHNLFLSGPVSLPSLQNGGMCTPNTNLLTSNAFSAIDFGHVTLPQLATLKLFPVQSIDPDTLSGAGYTSRYGQNNLLTGLGLQATILGHINPSQLESNNLYPLHAQTGITLDTLQQANYLTSDCIPTALSIAALHIGYLSSNSLESLGCSINDYSEVGLSQLKSASYVFGNLITPIGLAALRVGYLSSEFYKNLGVFPFAGSIQTPASVYDQDQQQDGSVGLSDFVRAGYIHANNHLITGAAYYAIERSILTIEHFHSLNVWPCPGTPSLNMFITAGYASYSGHLTTLGYSLLHAEYFRGDLLARIGIRFHQEFQIFHQALQDGGCLPSKYHDVHAKIHGDALWNEDSKNGENSSETAPTYTHHIVSDSNAAPTTSSSPPN